MSVGILDIQERVLESPVAEDTGDCEPLNIGAGKRSTQILCNSSACS